jgi:uncharacterized protein (TIGR03086 family)
VADRLPLDFDPPVRQLSDEWTVGDLLDHIMDFTRAFTQAAQKLTDAPGTSTPAPRPSAGHLAPHWRSRLPVLLEDLATAWKVPAAWTGSARAGGATMPATTTGAVAVHELTMHSWDLARATGQDFAADPRILEALIEFLSHSPGAFGPVVEIEDEASLLDQVLALSGRDPSWRSPAVR